MLVETINRHDSQKKIKLVCVETVINSGKSLSKIHSVPALVLLPENRYLFGKQVFDYLLLPGTGKLLIQSQSSKNKNQQNTSDKSSNDTEPAAFNMNSYGLSDNFSSIDDDNYNEHGDANRLYNWTSINFQQENTNTSVSDSGLSPEFQLNQESRSKKELPDISEFQARRAIELNQNDLNVSTLPPAVASRQ
ncbi:MAG: hypothetical protein EB127_27175 [Alphaproteobacteria bacterium]|nr:hypothetical protein [Alphaproteobacteria bacterium]